MEFIIVTGVSGAGKTVAMHALEDIGFYCVDNLPPQLITPFYDLCKKSSELKTRNVAVVADLRGKGLFETIERLRANTNDYKLLFLDARTDSLLSRFSQTRRRHPFAKNYNGSLEKAIEFEKSTLQTVRSSAEYVIDTSLLSSAQLKDQICALFLQNSSALIVNCMSFGFKYGPPTEANLLFDIRCLPNPFYEDDLRNLTGLDGPVQNFVLKNQQTEEFVGHMLPMIDFLLPLYEREGKSELNISVGCTGGKHRSVAIVGLLKRHLEENSIQTTINHRDITKR